MVRVRKEYLKAFYRICIVEDKNHDILLYLHDILRCH